MISGGEGGGGRGMVLTIHYLVKNLICMCDTFEV
jgi:hypothetical protein